MTGECSVIFHNALRCVVDGVTIVHRNRLHKDYFQGLSRSRPRKRTDTGRVVFRRLAHLGFCHGFWWLPTVVYFARLVRPVAVINPHSYFCLCVPSHPVREIIKHFFHARRWHPYISHISPFRAPDASALGVIFPKAAYPQQTAQGMGTRQTRRQGQKPRFPVESR